MVRRSQAGLVALFAALSLGARAQTPLPRLHVTSLTLRADTLHPQLEKPFHLLISAHFKESLASVDFIVLPNLAEFDDLGSERHTLAGPKGTDFTETLTVVAHHTGAIRINPVYLNAIDARDGKPKTFSSNALTVIVEGGPLLDPLAGLRQLVSFLIKLLLILAAVFVVAALFFRRRPIAVPAPAAAPVVLPTPVPVRPPHELLRDELRLLRAAPTRANVMRVRKALWAMAGAGEGETLADVLGRLHGRDPALHPVLRLTERAAFVQEAFLHGAIEDMIVALERYLA